MLRLGAFYPLPAAAGQHKKDPASHPPFVLLKFSYLATDPKFIEDS
jgi:hypothetical protein